MNRQELFNTVVMASVFVLVFSAWTICVLLWLVQYSLPQRVIAPYAYRCLARKCLE
jgi:hypothetical protein